MTSEITLGFKIDLRITALDIRDPIFAYYHEVERSRENQEAQRHGQALVTKTFRDGGRYWVSPLLSKMVSENPPTWSKIV
jgi:hypothetical protein